jgi:hypothetical protein
MSERPAIIQVDEDVLTGNGDGHVRVVITLSWEGEQHAGVAEGDAAPESRPRIAGEATLRAVEEAAEGRLRLSLSAVATAGIGPARIALAHVRVDGLDGDFVGNAVLGSNDPTLASVKAVLDALNRPLGRLL